MSAPAFVADHAELFVRQRRELVEILIDWETGNQYTVLDSAENELATVVERKGGFFSFFRRGFLRSHRPLEIRILDGAGANAMQLSRPFFFLFSTLAVEDAAGRALGRVERRFGILYKKYDLKDASDHVFARIRAPRWRLWTFPIEGADGVSAGTISKKWSGMLKEMFTDADMFRIEFGTGNWIPAQRAVMLAAAIAIDFDFFENNQGSDGVLSFGSS